MYNDSLRISSKKHATGIGSPINHDEKHQFPSPIEQPRQFKLTTLFSIFVFFIVSRKFRLLLYRMFKNRRERARAFERGRL